MQAGSPGDALGQRPTAMRRFDLTPKGLTAPRKAARPKFMSSLEPLRAELHRYIVAPLVGEASL